MSLKNRWFHSIAFRLASLYTLIFAICFLLVFVVLYWGVATYIQKIEDEWLLQEAKQLHNSLQSAGEIEEMTQKLQLEASAWGTNQIFYCLRDRNGKPLALSHATWPEILKDNKYFPRHENSNIFFDTIKLAQGQYPLRTLYFPVASGNVLQVAYSLQNSTQFLRRLASTFVLVYPLITIIFWILGFSMVKRSLHPVHTITQSARQISGQDLQRKIPIKDKQNELGELATTLNQMLARIAKLMGNIQDMCDNLAHDLRTPISRIRGIVEVSLLRERSSMEYAEVLKDCLEECDRLLAMINTILDISEVEAGIISIKREKIKINDLLLETVDMFDAIAEQKNLILKYQKYSPDIYIRGDRQRLQQVIINLLDNAIKYTPENGKVVVSATENSKSMMITIEDTGIGITPEDTDKIFERFYRSDSSRSLPGNGLGLSLVKAIVMAHNGNIGVESNLDKGSIFQIRLPINPSIKL